MMTPIQEETQSIDNKGEITVTTTRATRGAKEDDSMTSVTSGSWKEEESAGIFSYICSRGGRE